jgi:YhgE/Pip-like protein
VSAPPDPRADRRAPRTVRFWAAPIVLALAVLSALAVVYLGATLKPTSNLRQFPVAVVNDDPGQSGEQIVSGLTAALDTEKFDVRVLSSADALRQLDAAQVYGLVLIPPDFSAKFHQIVKSAITPGRVDRPVVTVSTNPRAGSLGATIAGQALNRAVGTVDTEAGEQLSARVAGRTDTPLSGAVSSVLASPIKIRNTVHNPLPEGTGNGLSAFYYSLLLLLAGFLGSIVVSALVDSMLGYVPARFGPAYRFGEQLSISRFRALLLKWALMIVLAVLTAAAYLGIAGGLGMPVPHGWALWAYGAFTIAAVGVTSTALIAVLGSVGVVASMLLFVIVGLPFAGSAVPLEATPPFFGGLAGLDPMRQVFVGTRALLYLDGWADAGLWHALVLTGIGLAIGVLAGAVITRAYDRRGYHRMHDAADIDSPDAALGIVDAADLVAQPGTDVTDPGWSGSSVIR